MLYRVAAVALAGVLLSSCGEESAFSGSTSPTTASTTDSGGGGGGSEGGTAADTTGGGTTPTASSIVRKTQIPSAIPDGMGGTLTVSLDSYDMGNSDASIS